MPSSTDHPRIDGLSLGERMLYAHAVIDSAIAEAKAAPVTPEQLKEIRCCDAAVESGELKCTSWKIVRQRLFAADRPDELFTQEQLVEIDRRVAGADAGEIVSEPMEAVFDKHLSRKESPRRS